MEDESRSRSLRPGWHGFLSYLLQSFRSYIVRRLGKAGKRLSGVLRRYRSASERHQQLS